MARKAAEARTAREAERGPRATVGWAWRVAPPLAIAALALASFWPSTAQGFVIFDDDRNFDPQYAPLLGDLSGAGWRWMFQGFHFGHWHPLTWLSFALDCALFGRDAGAFHRTNVVLHALGAVAFYWAALALLRSGFDGGERAPSRGSELALRCGAAFAAVAWALHPLRVESVAWATERRDVLSGLFLLLSLLAYLRRAREGERRRAVWLALSLAAYAASLASKAWGITFPVLLFALDVYPLRRRARGESWRALALEKLAFAPLAIGCAVLASRAQAQVSAVMSLEEHTLWERFAQACYGLCFYVGKTLWPTDLSCLYLLELDFDAARPSYLACQAAVIAGSGLLFALRRRFPAGACAFATFALLAAPVLGFLQSGTQKVADRYTYLAAMPLAVLAGAGLASLAGLAWRRLGERRANVIALSSVAISLAFAAALVPASRAQTRVWKDSETLFTRALEVEPDNYFVAHQLATILYGERRFAEALALEQRSVAAHPGRGNVDARHALGLIHENLGQPDEAEGAWRDALDVDPAHERSLQDLVRMLLRRRKPEEARAAIEATLAKAPQSGIAYVELANLELGLGRPADALEVWRRHARATKPRLPVATLAFAAQATPWDARVQNELGRALIAEGRESEAVAHLAAAVQAENRLIAYVSDLGLGYALAGNAAEAQRCSRWVLESDPSNARARSLLAISLAGAGR